MLRGDFGWGAGFRKRRAQRHGCIIFRRVETQNCRAKIPQLSRSLPRVSTLNMRFTQAAARLPFAWFAHRAP